MMNKLDGRRTDGIARRQRICELLLENGYVDVGELSKQLNADTATIRRDLQKLEAEGTARRVHGGAYPEAGREGVEVDFGLRMNFHAEAKRRIAARAAALVKNGDTVFLDAGTTSLLVAQELMNHKSLVVATNSLPAAEILRSARGVDLFVVGGRYLPHTRSLVGPMAEDSIRSLQFRKMILATAGIDFKHQALTMSSLEEVPVKRAAVARSEQVILTADRSKFGKPSLISMIPLDVVRTVVTEAPVPDDAKLVLDGLHIEIISSEDSD